MRLKSFYAPTMADAMDLVRSILGDDAIIVATREEADGVRVTAAVEEGKPLPAQQKAPPSQDRETQAETLAMLSEAIASVREDATPPAALPADVVEEVSDGLYKTGVPARIAEKLIKSIEGLSATDPIVALAAGLSGMFKFEPLPTGKLKTPIAFIGPPGSGKTLAIAKLATRAVVAGLKVGLITTDTVRAGGIEQLASFARLLKVNLITVEDPGTLADSLTVHRGCDQVWIDTAGRNPYDIDDMRELRSFLQAAPVDPVLVLPAGGDALETIEIARAFQDLGAKRLLLTRVDTSRRYGGLIGAAHDTEMAFCDISETAKVAAGLKALAPVSLAQMILPQIEGGTDVPKAQEVRK